MFHGRLDLFQKPPLGGTPNTKPGCHGVPNVHNHWFILFYHVWGHAWIEFHLNSMWLRARSHMTSHSTWWGFMTTLHDFGGGLGRPLVTFCWALTFSWSWLLARVWSGPDYYTMTIVTHILWSERILISNDGWWWRDTKKKKKKKRPYHVPAWMRAR